MSAAVSASAKKPLPPDPEGPHQLPPDQQTRLAFQGRRIDGGDTCTVILIRDKERHCWVLYPYGMAEMGIRLGDDDARVAAEFILARGQ